MGIQFSFAPSFTDKRKSTSFTGKVFISDTGPAYTQMKLEKGSVESTHKVPTSHYRTKHCHAAVAPLGGLTHR